MDGRRCKLIQDRGRARRVRDRSERGGERGMGIGRGWGMVELGVVGVPPDGDDGTEFGDAAAARSTKVLLCYAPTARCALRALNMDGKSRGTTDWFTYRECAATTREGAS